MKKTNPNTCDGPTSLYRRKDVAISMARRRKVPRQAVAIATLSVVLKKNNGHNLLMLTVGVFQSIPTFIEWIECGLTH